MNTAPAFSSASPGQLVMAASGGDSAAWDTLVGRYSGLLWSVARGFRLDQADAADVIQTAWLRLLEHLDGLRDPEQVGAWLATTTRNECLRHLRRAGRERPTDVVELDVVDEVAAPVDAALLQAQASAELWQAFDQIPDRCRTLLRVLMADPPPSYDEVAGALDMPVGSIGPTRGRCLNRLRRELLRLGVAAPGNPPPPGTPPPPGNPPPPGRERNP